MDFLYEQFAFKLRNIKNEFKRSLYDTIDWTKNPIVIKGACGTGKTYLALQFVKNNFKISYKVLYVSLDYIYFSHYSFEEFIDNFVAKGGKLLIVDDIHKYKEGSEVIEKVLKKYENLRLILLGHSLENYTTNQYIASKAAVYDLPIMSLREFMIAQGADAFSAVSLEDILNNTFEISSEITHLVDPNSFINAYYRYGCYPFFLCDRSNFSEQLLTKINGFLYSDLTYTKSLDVKNISKIRQLLWISINSFGSKLNITEMSSQIGVTRATLLQYLDYLEKGKLLNLLKYKDKQESIMTKPDKVFPGNVNIAFSLSEKKINKRFLDKTFLQSQFAALGSIYFNEHADFEFKDKLFQSLSNMKAKNINEKLKIHAVDMLEIGVNNKFPLWLFGFMY